MLTITQQFNSDNQLEPHSEIKIILSKRERDVFTQLNPKDLGGKNAKELTQKGENSQ